MASNRKIYSFEEILSASLKCATKKEFYEKYPEYYKSAHKKKWLVEICSHMPKRSNMKKDTPKEGWTVEAIKADALKYTTRGEWNIKSQWAYNKSKELKIFDECVSHMKEPWIIWTLEKCKEEASKYKNKSEWKKASYGSYQAAHINGWFDLCASHMPKYYPAVDIAHYLAIAKTFETRGELWSNQNKVGLYFSRKGLLDIALKHAPVLHGFSLEEKELLTWLQTISLDFKPKKFKKFWLDCYSEKLNLGIEYNGLYWHSDERKRNTRYHREKTEYFEEMGIRVIHIWQHEWREREEQVKNYLRSACNGNYLRLGARECEFKEIEPELARKFVNENHIQKCPPSIILALGCYYKEQLLAVSTFGNHHRQNGGNEAVLNRFVCEPNFTISGALAKFTKMAYEKLGPLKSWADYSKSQGNGYVVAGWDMVKVLNPDYFYSDTQARFVSKQSRMKSKINTPSGLTELEHAKKDKLYRVWDCGKILLIYDPKK